MLLKKKKKKIESSQITILSDSFRTVFIPGVPIGCGRNGSCYGEKGVKQVKGLHGNYS